MNKLIIPILNDPAALFPGPRLYLDDETWIDKLSDEEFGQASKSPPLYAEQLKTEQKCLFANVHSTDVDVAKAAAAKLATKVRYVLNNFRRENPLILNFAIFLHESANGTRKKQKISAIDFDEPSGNWSKSKNAFRFKTGINRGDISQFYKVVDGACNKHRKLFLTLSRFNSSLSREKFTDRIIDATISLESMVQDDKNELSFKFALYNAHACSTDSEKRAEAFEQFKDLYSTRSTIVHGAADEEKEQRLIGKIENNWSTIEKYASSSINYHLFFMNQSDPKNWIKHLISRSLEQKDQLAD
ncbi:HEPN domain-containing protein [Burkholderia pseudomultivorans]|uniref:HEPN domain-containing protein n=1 Tax=Burkholderia pseudomultivorans TaxID=1207504 RepID=UPI00188EF55C|nr:HEPN domain-containing protein [Burkholderia pseudomultivorans]MBF5014631.1 hypothetical protein [Burkholderia pseudomultivorans]